MTKDQVMLKGTEALDECIRMWRLNDTFKGTTVNHGRMLSPGGKMCLLDDESWDYFIAHAETKHLMSDLADIREHMQGQPNGTNMFWWRGRHRPKNADSFDENRMRKILEELALAKMGYDGGRRWFTDKCRDMTLADMRRSGLKALCLDMPKTGYGSGNFFFRGPFWDLHYWDESSRKRLVDTVHAMWSEENQGE